MKVIVTICSKEKDRTTKDIPAYRRYKSSRIKTVRSVAQAQSLPFFILSGKYGLIADNEVVPYYDHLLNESHVQGLALRVGEQGKLAGITSIEFYAKQRQGSWIPYYRVIEQLAITNNIKLNIIKLD